MTDRVKEILSWYRSENPGVLTNLARWLDVDAESARRPSSASPTPVTWWFAESRASVNVSRTSGSSSTTRIRPGCAGAGASASAGIAGAVVVRGSRMRNVVPQPGSLSTAISPPWRVTIP